MSAQTAQKQYTKSGVDLMAMKHINELQALGPVSDKLESTVQRQVKQVQSMGLKEQAMYFDYASQNWNSLDQFVKEGLRAITIEGNAMLKISLYVYAQLSQHLVCVLLIDLHVLSLSDFSCYVVVQCVHVVCVCDSARDNMPARSASEMAVEHAAILKTIEPNTTSIDKAVWMVDLMLCARIKLNADDQEAYVAAMAKQFPDAIKKLSSIQGIGLERSKRYAEYIIM